MYKRQVFVLPVVQRADRLNMRLLKIDVKTPETGVKTKEGVSLWLDSVVTVQVYSENSTVSDEEMCIRDRAGTATDRTDELMLKGLFTTITNVNFNNETILQIKNDIEKEKAAVSTTHSVSYTHLPRRNRPC